MRVRSGLNRAAIARVEMTVISGEPV